VTNSETDRWTERIAIMISRFECGCVIQCVDVKNVVNEKKLGVKRLFIFQFVVLVFTSFGDKSPMT